jgi:hypothetical protein
MASEEGTTATRRSRQAPGIVAPTTRINLALPLSKITVEEPGRELAELAAIVNSDASPGITVRADVGVSSPALPWLAGELLTAGVLVGVAAAALVIVPVRLASRARP